MLGHMKDTLDAITRRAFEIFEGDGRRMGRDLENWVQAEHEFLHPLHLEISEADGTLTIRAEVPGFSENEIEVNLEPRRVTISGKRETAEEKTTGKTIYSECCSNQTYRVVDLPTEVDTASDAIKASYAKGVLTISLPKAEKANARPVKVEAKATS
jgi:HSP20 family protein